MAKPREILKESCRHREGLFGDMMLRNALFYPHREAFVYGDRRITFKQYNRRVNSLVHALADMGVEKGDVLGILSWNCIECMDVIGAAQKGGFIFAPFNVRLPAKEIEYLINDSEAKALFIGGEFADMVGTLKPKIPGVRHFINFEGSLSGMESHAGLLARYPIDEPDADVDEEERLFICYTSGTTGQPRGALYTHQRLRENVICHALEVPIGNEDRGISLMPLFHIGGITIQSYLFYQTATAVIMKFFDPKALLEAIEREKITNIAVVPTHLTAMLDLSDFQKYDVSSIKRIFYAGSPMPTELLKRGMKAFGSVFFQGYGQTESGPDIAFLKEKDHEVLGDPVKEERLLSCGHPALGVHVRIVECSPSMIIPEVRSRAFMKIASRYRSRSSCHV